MTLTSLLFRESQPLQACAVSNPAHVKTGASGEHVARIQRALQLLDNAAIDLLELKARRYGPSTAAAVLAYKRKRHIINTSYQTTADNIVGIMTIKAMDKELNDYPSRPTPLGVPWCTRIC